MFQAITDFFNLQRALLSPQFVIENIRKDIGKNIQIKEAINCKITFLVPWEGAYQRETSLT